MRKYVEDAKKPLPIEVGLGVMALSGVGCVLMPVSGIWLWYGAGMYITYRAAV